MSKSDWDTLECHNKNTWGDYQPTYMALVSELRFFYPKPDGVKNTKWKYYVSDVARFLNLKGLRFGRHTVKPESSCFYILSRAVDGDKQLSMNYQREAIEDALAAATKTFGESSKKVYVEETKSLPETELGVELGLKVRKKKIMVKSKFMDFTPAPRTDKILEDACRDLSPRRLTYKDMMMKEVVTDPKSRFYMFGVGSKKLKSRYKEIGGAGEPIFLDREMEVDTVKVEMNVVETRESRLNKLKFEASKGGVDKKQLYYSQFKLELTNRYEPLSDVRKVEEAINKYYGEVNGNGLLVKKKLNINAPASRKKGGRSRGNKVQINARLKIMRKALKGNLSLSVIEIHAKKNDLGGSLSNLVREGASHAVAMCRQGYTSLKIIKDSAKEMAKSVKFSNRCCTITIECFLRELSNRKFDPFHKNWLKIDDDESRYYCSDCDGHGDQSSSTGHRKVHVIPMQVDSQ